METNEIKALRAGYYVDMNGNLTKNGKPLNPKPDKRGGYLIHHGSLYSERFQIKVHRLQAFIKFGEQIYSEKIHVRHLNGNPSDNSFDNIAIGSPSENQYDVPEEVRKARPRHYRKTTNLKGDSIYDVEKVVELHKNGFSYRQIMKELGIKSASCVSRLINNTAKERGLL